MKVRLFQIGLGLILTSFSSSPASAAEKFFFGASNAAFQVEGSPEDSDWREWTKTGDAATGKSHIWNGDHAEKVTDFWNLYDTDFAFTQKAGMNSFRMSVAWERIEPAPGQWNEKALDHYVQIIQAMRARGIEPFVTLNHYVLPLWVSRKGGLNWSEYPRHFGEFCKHVVDRLAKDPKSRVVYFMTLNEPNIQVRFGFLDAHKFPPGVNDANLATRALAGLAKAHIQAVRQIRSLALKQVKVGLAHNWQVFEPLNPNSKADRDMANTVDWMFNRAFMAAIMTGDIHFWMPGAERVLEHVEIAKGPMLDFLGVQNYGRSFVTPTKEAPGYALSDASGDVPKNDLGWELVPDALYKSVKQAATYGFPVIITETGVADAAADDKIRQNYIRSNFATLRRLLAEKVELFGYIHWSLTDNFEWAFGLAPRFGLISVNYHTLQRTPRTSFMVITDLIREFRNEYPKL